MPRYAQGAPVTLSTEVRDTSGNLTAPGGILLRVRKPDGTFLPDYTSPTADDTGKYHQDLSALDLAALGHYQYAWITTGTAAGVSPPASFQVVDPFAPTHVSFQDAKARLNLSASSDDEIQAMLASAVSEQEQWVGAVAPRQVTETVFARHGRLSLSTRPVLSVVSATVSGSPQDVSGWRVPSAMAGLVELGTGPWWGYGPHFSSLPYTVVYTAGRNPVPQDLVEAALLRVNAAYETQRGPAGMPLADVDAEPSGTSYPLILRARDMEAPYRLPAVA